MATSLQDPTLHGIGFSFLISASYEKILTVSLYLRLNCQIK